MVDIKEQLNKIEKKKQVLKKFEDTIVQFVNQKDVKNLIKQALKANIEGYYKSGSKYVTLNIPIIYNTSIFNPQNQYRFVIKEKDTTLVYLTLEPSFFKQKIKVDIITYEEEFITEKEIIEFLTVLLGI